MIQVNVSGELAYNSRLPAYSLLALSYTEGLNKAGTAQIKMPPGHPAYDLFAPYKPIVTIYEDGVLLFRGRPLKPQDDFYNRRTITCEGERCFFQDAAMAPYLYQAAPDEIFRDVVETYNSQVEEDKRFVVGEVTVKDDNDYLRMENSSPEQVGDTIDKLVKRCGGYIVFTTTADGKRAVNWYAELNYRNNQSIEFGHNLTNFSRVTENNELATRIIPSGAKDMETGEYVTIESVNDGVRYIEDAEAIQLRGIITRPVTFDNVTQPANLKRKAEEWLAKNRNLITSLTVTALDLAKLHNSGQLISPDSIGAIRETLDAFRVGDLVRVRSRPHRVDEDFLLTDRTVNLLTQGASLITMGKKASSLTGISKDHNLDSRSELQATVRDVRAEYTLNIANAVAETQRALTTLIEQTSEAIRLEVSESYATNGNLEEAISTSMTQLSDQFLFEFNSLRATVDENDADARAKLTEIYNYISFENGDIKLGASDSAITLTLENDTIVFKKNGVQFGWWDGVDFHTGNIVVEVNERAQFGAFAFVPRSNGSLSFLKVGG